MSEIINSKRNITFISTPFIGHFNTLFQYASEILSYSHDTKITFIITGWANITLSDDIKRLAAAHNINLIEIYDDVYAPTTEQAGPFYFTFPRVASYVDKVIEACRHTECIIYDHFSLEGYIAGKHLNIPSICSTASIMGPFYRDNQLFCQAMAWNQAHIECLEEKFKITLMNKIQMLGDGFYIPSDEQNILWSWPALTQVSDYHHDRELNNITFMRPANVSNNESHDYSHIITHLKHTEKKIIYISFGTIVTRLLYDGIPALKKFLDNIYSFLLSHYADHPDYEFVISTGVKEHELFNDVADNFHIYEYVPQRDILKHADVFITHGGGNSINESIDADVPVIVIPFFGDQHQSAENAAKLNIGISMMHDEKCKDKVIDSGSGIYDRESLSDLHVLAQAIHDVISNDEMKHAISEVKQRGHI